MGSGYRYKGTPLSVAIALASSVFPTPGGPISRMPLGILAPISLNFVGFRMKSTMCTISDLYSSIPVKLARNKPQKEANKAHFCLTMVTSKVQFKDYDFVKNKISFVGFESKYVNFAESIL